MPNLNDIMEMMDALETKAIITIPTFCVAVRNRHSSCRKCADVCLADAFTIEKNELNIDAGACVAAEPAWRCALPQRWFPWIRCPTTWPALWPRRPTRLVA